MKYKLINTKTKEEHLCDKVTIDGFDYYVSDETPKKEGERCYSYYINELTMYGLPHKIQCKKVIATNNPNIDIPKVGSEVEMLAKQNGFDWENTETSARRVFEKWYKSQETHPFSEEDMIEFYKWVNQPHPEDNRQPTAVYVKNIDMWWHNHKKYTSKELLQLWKEQKPKIVYYE